MTKDDFLNSMSDEDDDSVDSLPECLVDEEDLNYLQNMSNPLVLSSILARGDFDDPEFLAYLHHLRYLTPSQFGHIFQNNPGSQALLQQLIQANLQHIIENMASIKRK